MRLFNESLMRGRKMNEFVDAYGVHIILLLIGSLWYNLLKRIDRLEEKLNLSNEKYVKVEYIENDLKPWIRDIEKEVHSFRRE